MPLQKKLRKDVYEALQEIITSNRALALTSPNQLTRDIAQQILDGQLDESVLFAEVSPDIVPSEVLKAMNAANTLMEFFDKAEVQSPSAAFMKGLLYAMHHYAFSLSDISNKKAV